MEDKKDSLAAGMLRLLAKCVLRAPHLFVWPQVILFGLCVFYTIKKLEFDTSRNNLIGSDKIYHQNYLKFKSEFSGEDDLVAIVESEDHEKNRQFVERLGSKMERAKTADGKPIFTDVFYKGDLKMLGRKALLFLDEPTLVELSSTLKDYSPFIQQFTKATNLNSLFQLINRQFRTAKQEENAENQSLVKAIPALTRLINQANQSIHRSGTPPSPGVTALFDAGEEAQEQQYITFAKGRIYLVNARPHDAEVRDASVETLRRLVAETQAEVPGVNSGITGEPILEMAEMEQSQNDTAIATVVSLVLCALIFIYGYRQTGRPLKATLALIIGLGYTMGYTTLSVGHLNILTITFLPILIGLAIDYGVHLITRFEEELRHGRTPAQSIELAMVNTGMGIFTGALTISVAFFAMALTDFKGIQEMGIITGGGLLICLIPMMTTLPALLLKGRQNVIDHDLPPEKQTRARIERLWLDRPRGVILTITGLCMVALALGTRVAFDYNLLHMQSKGLPAVEVEMKLIDSASKSVLFAASVTDTPEQAVALEKQLTNLPSVFSVDSMGHFLTGDQNAKLQKVTALKKDLEPIRFAESDMDDLSVDDLSRTLWSLQGYLGLALDSINHDQETNLVKELSGLRTAIKDLRFDLLNRPRNEVVTRLTGFQQALLADMRDTFTALKSQDVSGPLRPEDLPSSLRNRFIGKSGKHLIQIYPRGNAWERKPQEEFIKQVRAVDPNVTGTPIQLFEYTTLLKDSYIKAAWYSLGAIALMVFVHFRRVSCVFLALLPVGIGALWMLGTMGLLGIPFNPANIMTLPLVIGIGVTNGIHILNRFAEEQNASILAKSTGKAVFVSALTTMAGFGSLMPAKHQGIASLGIVMTVGVATCMAAALTVLPAILTLLMRRGWKIK